MNNIIPKYLTHTKLNILYKLCRIYKIFHYTKLKKNHIIKKLNLKLLFLLDKKIIIVLCEQLKLNTNNSKIKLIYNINNKIKKTNKLNTISIFYNKYNLVKKPIIKLNSNKYQIIRNKTQIIKNNKLNNEVNNKGNNEENNKLNNESFGITCEYVICQLYNLNNNLINRINYNYIDNLSKVLNKFKIEFKSNHNLKCFEYIGYQNKSYDFLCSNNKLKKKINILLPQKNYTLSVKSNINLNYLLCPQNIGQCTFNSFIKFIRSFKEYKTIKIKTLYQIKKFISKNLVFLFNQYYKNLFCCDFLLWITKYNQSIHYKLFTNKKNIKINNRLLKLNKKIKYWNESNVLKYNNISIGIFQIHNNRNCIKFRFYFKNLLKMIN